MCHPECYLLILLSIIVYVNPILLSMGKSGFLCRIHIERVRVCFMLYSCAVMLLGYLFYVS